MPKSEREILIEQCLVDAHCSRTGEIVDESVASWFAGKKAKLGAAAKNVGTGIANAAKSVGNAGVIAGRATKTGLSNAKKGAIHKMKQTGRKLASAGLQKLGATGAAGEIDARRQQADNDFQYDTVDTSKRFEAGKYENTANAEQTAQRATLAKQIAELLTQFQSVGGKIPKVGIQTLVNYLNSIQ